jgi:hypothetical protein
MSIHVTYVGDAPLPRVADRAHTITLFSVVLFASAFLLFVLEPMVAKILLPKLGGTPQVWNTCMVFFQTTLLAGYLLAHWSVRRNVSTWLHPLLLLGSIATLPLSFVRTPIATNQPAVWLFVELVRVAGLPVLALSMTAPTLQSWFSRTRLHGSQDPYFLYAASNAGSLCALLSYPAIIEPELGLQPQARWWAAGYVALVAMVCACVVVARRNVRPGTESSKPLDAIRTDPWQRLRWITLAFIPSSLMLGVTTYITTDVAAVPLIWVVPLALYLATFIIAFGRFSTSATAIAERRLPLLAVVVVMFLSANIVLPIALNIPLHLAVFTAAAMMCHGQLAATRPPVQRLTEFYLLMSLGGTLGGLFNTLIAPLVFNTVAEYPAILICACAIPALRSHQTTRKDIARDVLYAIAIAGFIAVVTFLARDVLAVSTRIKVAVLGVVAIAIFSQLRRPLRFSMMLSAMLLACALTWHPFEAVIHAERTFFGSYHVSQDPRRRFHILYHGTTVHGMESLDPSRQQEPLTYYYRSGPFGQAFERLPQLRDASDIAAVGLGVGSLAPYAREFQQWTFYEIDPAVERIARNDQYFRFLSACGSRCRVVLGDARLSLARSNAQFDAIVLDAFSSDSIPVHLVTREAFDMYLHHLKPRGLLMFHISNRYLRLENVLGRLAGARGLEILMQSDRPAASATNEGYQGSDWVIASPDSHALDPLAADSRWTRIETGESTPLWTDDFSNILTVLKWGRR